MDIESLRSKNIQRNQDLLRKLNLDTLHLSIRRDAQPAPKQKRAKKATPQPSRAIPTRRSRRLANTPESKEEKRVCEERAELERLRQQRLKKLRATRLRGVFPLTHLAADPRLGELVHEDRLVGGKENVVKKVDIECGNCVETDFLGVQNRLLVLHDLGTRYSQPSDANDTCAARDRDDTRKLLLRMALAQCANPREFKLTVNRITSIHLHLSTADRLVAAGDTSGILGLWAIDRPHDGEPIVALLKPHGRSIARILEMAQNPQCLVTASYDGSCRAADLVKMASSELFAVGDPEDPVGISDLAVISPNLLYATTLDGQFFRRDPREPLAAGEPLRLHDKKIGGFCVNPNAEHQIATASLDRTMRVWDLRNISAKNSVSELHDGLCAPHLYGAFSSRLSISNVDWNQNNRLVCNGYDDRIQLLDYGAKRGAVDVITRWFDTYRPPGKNFDPVPDNLRSFKTISHNCQTGRWVSILKARWQRAPADGVQKFAIANMQRSIDVFDENGLRLASLHDPDLMTAVPAVVAFHPTRNWLVGGTSSGKVFLFE
ncbi:WD40 repeat-like protein [Metschnikowia bicuspidata]|uniref:DNA damage-binding protein CMR1 n=1 Tax=Metschnikowia bicuspidata TaxID=27322 RepID=A0A4V1J3D9_9ASCO|nr:WD40 repeat-like protein [Metschnikowia bicuspidata]